MVFGFPPVEPPKRIPLAINDKGDVLGWDGEKWRAPDGTAVTTAGRKAYRFGIVWQIAPSEPSVTWALRAILAFAPPLALLALGLLLVLLREYRDSSFRHEDEVHRLLSLPVLALIPVMTSTREDRRARRRTRLMDLVGSTVLTAAIAIVVYWRFGS